MTEEAEGKTDEEKGTIDHDGLYKELLRTFFREFIELFFPEVAEQIDFSHVEFLSEEVVVDIVGGTKKRLDILVKTRLKGEELFILVHTEPQAYYERAFPERMFIYAARLYEKYRLGILPIALLSHDREVEEPESFGWSLPFLDVLQFRYYRVQLKAYNWREFIQSDNPVAAALLSSMGYNEGEKIQLKLEFVRMMTRMQLNPAKTALLTAFFDTYLPLKKEEKKQVQQEIRRIYGEEGHVMKLESGWAKLAREEGREEGIEEGIKETARNMLKKGLAHELIAEVTGMQLEEISKMQLSLK